jgi:hypothetical protein
MVEVGIAQLVRAAAGVKAILGDPARMYPVLIPESPVYPLATYQLISDMADYTLDGSAGIEVKRIQIDTWSGGEVSASYLDAKNAAEAIRNVLEGYSGQLPEGTYVAGVFVAQMQDLYEQDARAYRVLTDYKICYYPPA